MSTVETKSRPAGMFAIEAPLQPVTQPNVAVRDIPVPAAVRPALWSREVATHAALGLAQVGAIGSLAYLATSSVTLVAAALAGAVATGVAIAKAAASRNATSQVAAALDADRRALTATRDLLAQQTGAIAADRGRLDAELAHVKMEREHLAGERANIAQRVSLEAHNLTAPVREALAAERAQLDQRIAEFESRRAKAKTPLEAEAEALTVDEIVAIKAAADAYCGNTSPYYRFAARAYTGGSVLSSEHAIAGTNALATLVGTGQLVAGVCVQAGGTWVVPTGGATTITSIQQLRTFLRVATGLQA